MPGFTTHYLFGQQTYQLLENPDLKQSIQKQHTVYCLGLQGPDIFFYDVLSSVSARKNPGSIAHTAETGKFLRFLLEGPRIFPSEKERQTARIYALGFMGHYLLDTVCHPYIYAITHYSRHKKGYIGKHIRLETDIDTALLWRFQHRRPSEFHQNESITLSKEQRITVATLLYFAFLRAYPNLGIKRRGILHAIRAMQTGTKLLYDPTGRKKTFLRRLESIVPGYPILSPLVPNDTLIFHKDPCNLKRRLWTNPWDPGQMSRESFYELFEKAQIRYCRILKESESLFLGRLSPEEYGRAMSGVLVSLGDLCYHSGLNSAPYLP